MASKAISDREQALIDAARRELRGRDAPAPTAPATTPLDQPTVLGWDHPAAQETPAAVAADKWAAVAEMMEAERRVEAERRARLRRGVTYVLVALVLVLVVAVVMSIRR
jgi:hypothetical protein